MKNPYDGEDLDRLRNKLIGLGEQSFRKSYYPELQKRLSDLERFRTLLDQSNDAICLIHAESITIVDVNESGCLQLGYPYPELVGKKVHDVFELAQAREITREVLPTDEQGRFKTISGRLRKKNGEQFPVEVTIRMVEFDHNEYVVAVARDISERLAIEEKVREQFLELQAAHEELTASYEEIEALSGEVEESYNNLINKNLELSLVKERLELALWGARAGMWDWYIKTGDLIFNDRYAEIHGYSLGELPAKLCGWENRVHPQDWPYVEQNLYDHVEGRTPFFDVEYRIANKAGEWIWIQDNGKVVSWDNDGQPERAVGTIQEITARKHTELALRESQQRYHEVYTNTSNGIFLIDLTRDGRFCYVGCNPVQEKISGVLSRDICGKYPEELFSPEMAAKLTANYRHCIEIGQTVNYQEVLELPAGQRYFRTKLIPVCNAAGEIYRLIEMSEDITIQKRAAIFEAQAMKMTTMSAMSAGVVHEISQPLNALKFLADGMLYRCELGRSISADEALDTIKKISMQAERINNIIRHMRNLSDSVQSDFFLPTDLNAAIGGGMKILGQQLSAHGIQVELDLDRNIAPVRGQEEQLEEIFINLVVNAMHALDEYEEENKRIKCLTYQKEKQVIMEIADNGPGISSKISSQIWEPFFTTRKGGKGMGLGLAIIQSIIAKQGGSIIHYKNEWGGASFVVTLPAYSQLEPGQA